MSNFIARIAFIMVFILGAFGISLGSMQAQEQSEVGATSVTVPANGEASLAFDTFCLEFQKEFPSQLSTPDGRASEAVVKVLKVAAENNSVETDPLQVQMAIWREALGDWPYEESVIARDTAQSLLDEARNTTVTPSVVEGTPLDRAVADGTISIRSEDFTSVEAPTARPEDQPYRGKGTLIITNNTAQEVTVYFPFGLLFESDNDQEPDMVAYATQQVQEATPTPQQTDTPQPTATQDGDMAPSPEAQATDTPQPTTTQDGDMAPSPEAQATDTPQPTATQDGDMAASGEATTTPERPEALPATGDPAMMSGFLFRAALLGGMLLIISGLLLMVRRLNA